MRIWASGSALVAAALLLSCAPRPAPAPPPPPPPRPEPRAAEPPPAPPAADWRDGPLSPGDWSYSGEGGPPRATFESAAGALLALSCEAGQVRLARVGAPPGPIAVVTSFGERGLASAGAADQATAILAASDPLLDQIAFSRGRFLVRVAGAADLVLPSWPEPARVIEDCRA